MGGVKYVQKNMKKTWIWYRKLREFVFPCHKFSVFSFPCIRRGAKSYILEPIIHSSTRSLKVYPFIDHTKPYNREWYLKVSLMFRQFSVYVWGGGQSKSYQNTRFVVLTCWRQLECYVKFRVPFRYKVSKYVGTHSDNGHQIMKNESLCTAPLFDAFLCFCH